MADVSRGVTNGNDTIGCLNETLTNVRAVHIIKEPQKIKENSARNYIFLEVSWLGQKLECNRRNGII